jgi:hypothetical protein
MRTAKLAMRTAKAFAVRMAARTAKIALPFVTLPWALCRGSMHGKGVAVSLLPFAVRAPRTATIVFPVVLMNKRKHADFWGSCSRSEEEECNTLHTLYLNQKT